jgi:phosphoribosylanthranilate isomerase
MSPSIAKIKVCGMRDPDNILRVVELQPDYIGFILFPGSKRYIGENYELSVDIPGSIKRVGVFVNSLIPQVIEWVNKLNLDYVQLHGSEPPEYCMELKNMGISIMKSFGIHTQFDFSVVTDYLPYCEYLLFDTETALFGGSGEQFDWSALKNYHQNKSFLLSGGISPGDAKSIKQLENPALHGVDINSRFETSPGLKDINIIKKFISELRSE